METKTPLRHQKTPLRSQKRHSCAYNTTPPPHGWIPDNSDVDPPPFCLTGSAHGIPTGACGKNRLPSTAAAAATRSTIWICDQPSVPKTELEKLHRKRHKRHKCPVPVRTRVSAVALCRPKRHGSHSKRHIRST